MATSFYKDQYLAQTDSDIVCIPFFDTAGMAKLDIEWLNVFVEIYKTQSVSLAAERLGMAQARASGVLNKLRHHFGDRLFARTSQGMRPTPYAMRIHPDIALCVARLAAVSNQPETFEPRTAQRRFHICMTDISEIVVLPELINEVRKLAPGVSIEAERIVADSPHRLEAGEVDLAVGYMPQLEAGFYQQTLFGQGFVCLASKHHPRIRSAPSRQAFLREGHVVVTTSGTGHAIVDRELASRRIERTVVLRVSSFLGVARIVARTELLAIVPRRLGESLASGEEISIFHAPLSLPTYDVKLHWHERFHADAGNVWLRHLIARLFMIEGERGGKRRLRAD
jgi:DNA-binding transcriptional LysR family regulator